MARDHRVRDRVPQKGEVVIWWGMEEPDGVVQDELDPGAPIAIIRKSSPWHWPDLFWWLR